MRHVVEVNECRVFAVAGEAAQWWTYWTIGQHPSRLTYPAIYPGGAVVEVACDDRDHADWLAGHLVEFGGLPRSAVKVRTLGEVP